MPAERTAMRHVREVLRLKFVGGIALSSRMSDENRPGPPQGLKTRFPVDQGPQMIGATLAQL
jgi:hypothetical protein